MSLRSDIFEGPEDVGGNANAPHVPADPALLADPDSTLPDIGTSWKSEPRHPGLNFDPTFLLNTIQTPVVMCDAEGKVTFTNLAFSAATGISPEVAHGTNLDSALRFDVLDGNSGNSKIQLRTNEADYRWHSAKVVPHLLTGSSTEVLGYTVTLIDIHDAETAAKRISSAERMTAEAYHRVKNDLQIIAATFELMLDQYPVSVPKEEVDKMRGLILGTASLSDLLGRQTVDGGGSTLTTKQLETVFIPMLNNKLGLTHELRSTFQDDIPLTPKQLSAICFIVNEAVTNAIKHTPGSAEAKGVITVSFVKRGDDGILEIRDSGKGFPKNFDPHTSGNIGMQVLLHLSDWNLKARPADIIFGTHVQGGGSLQITFPLEPPTDQ